MKYPIIPPEVYAGRARCSKYSTNRGDLVIRVGAGHGDMKPGNVCQVTWVSGNDMEVLVLSLDEPKQTGLVYVDRFVPFLLSDIQDRDEPI